MEKEPTNNELLNAIQGIVRTETQQLRTDLRSEFVEAIQNSQAEVLEAVHEFATNVDQRFREVDQRFDRVDQRFDRIESRLTRVEATMVTKDYLEGRLAREHAS